MINYLVVTDRKVYKYMISKFFMTIVNDIKPRGTNSAYVNDKPFDEAKAELEKAGYHISSLEENAQLRIQEGKCGSSNTRRKNFLCFNKWKLGFRRFCLC